MIQRFKILLSQLNLTPSEFADRIGVQRSSMSHILSGRNKPSIDFLEKILDVFPETDTNWLITGKVRTYDVTGKEDALPVYEEVTNPDSVNQKGKKIKPPDHDSTEPVDQIIIVFKNNTFRLLKPE